MSEWRPIETAPRSRTEPIRILSRSGKEYIAVIHCIYSGADEDPTGCITWQCAPGHGVTYSIHATHWQPLTTAPSPASQPQSK